MFALVTALLAPVANAVAVKPAKTAASAPGPRAWATRDQLRECLDLEAALKARFRDIEASGLAHEAKFNAVEAENAKLLEVQGQLDHDSETAIHVFNLLVADHNVHVKELNKDAADSRATSDAYNVDMLAVNRKCSPLAYRLDDMDAVLKERKQGAK